MQHIACLNQANQPVFYLSIYPQRSYVLIGGAWYNINNEDDIRGKKKEKEKNKLMGLLNA
jgi:hypothetical protein